MNCRAKLTPVNTIPMPNALLAVRLEKPNMGRNSMLAAQLMAKPMKMFTTASVADPVLV